MKSWIKTFSAAIIMVSNTSFAEGQNFGEINKSQSNQLTKKIASFLPKHFSKEGKTESNKACQFIVKTENDQGFSATLKTNKTTLGLSWSSFQLNSDSEHVNLNSENSTHMLITAKKSHTAGSQGQYKTNDELKLEIQWIDASEAPVEFKEDAKKIKITINNQRQWTRPEVWTKNVYNDQQTCFFNLSKQG